MGSFDGAEVCELVGLFLLDILGQRYKKENIGLYRDDGLAIFKNQNGRQNDVIRKDLVKFFKHHKLDLEITCNLKHVDYLDITFDLVSGTYKPFNKPNNAPLYIHEKSNHPLASRNKFRNPFREEYQITPLTKKYLMQLLLRTTTFLKSVDTMRK